MANDTQRGLGDIAGDITPTVRGLAIAALVALLILVLLRHLFGTVRLEVGTK